MSFYSILNSLSFLWFCGCGLHVICRWMPFANKEYKPLKNGPNPFYRNKEIELINYEVRIEHKIEQNTL